MRDLRYSHICSCGGRLLVPAKPPQPTVKWARALPIVCPREDSETNRVVWWALTDPLPRARASPRPSPGRGLRLSVALWMESAVVPRPRHANRELLVRAVKSLEGDPDKWLTCKMTRSLSGFGIIVATERSDVYPCLNWLLPENLSALAGLRFSAFYGQ
jgi:hypothetical protein